MLSVKTKNKGSVRESRRLKTRVKCHVSLLHSQTRFGGPIWIHCTCSLQHSRNCPSYFFTPNKARARPPPFPPFLLLFCFCSAAPWWYPGHIHRSSKPTSYVGCAAAHKPPFLGIGYKEAQLRCRFCLRRGPPRTSVTASSLYLMGFLVPVLRAWSPQEAPFTPPFSTMLPLTCMWARQVCV
jgi:hypothetical protein